VYLKDRNVVLFLRVPAMLLLLEVSVSVKVS